MNKEAIQYNKLTVSSLILSNTVTIHIANFAIFQFSISVIYILHLCLEIQ